MSYTNFTLDIDADGIALVTWDMPGRSMNVFTEEVMLGARTRSSNKSRATRPSRAR